MLNPKKLFTEMLDFMTLKPITVTPAIGKLVTNYSCKVGRLHVINFRIDNATTSGGTTATIPAAFKPSEEVVVILQLPPPTTIGNTQPYAWLNTSGEIKINTASNAVSNGSMRFFSVYYV